MSTTISLGQIILHHSHFLTPNCTKHFKPQLNMQELRFKSILSESYILSRAANIIIKPIENFSLMHEAQENGLSLLNVSRLYTDSTKLHRLFLPQKISIICILTTRVLQLQEFFHPDYQIKARQKGFLFPGNIGYVLGELSLNLVHKVPQVDVSFKQHTSFPQFNCLCCPDLNETSAQSEIFPFVHLV